MVNKMKGIFSFGVLLMLFGVSSNLAAFGYTPNEPKIQSVTDWKDFHSVPGRCSISMPHMPEHVQQVMPFHEEGFQLRYDVYLAAFEKKAVYMVLIAEYPPTLDQEYSSNSLEVFLNSLVTQREGNKLIFADITDVQGNKALDFFIETKGVYFKGRAIMAKNHLYLLAMECESKHYLENHFNHFITSFELKK